MKIIKFLLAFVGIILLIVLVLIFTQPKDYKITRTVEVNASDSIVFNYVSKFNNWGAWSPWKEMDAAAEYSIEGEDGTVGALYKWFGGNPDITGTGSMKVTELMANSKMTYDLHFTEPREMKSRGGFIIEPLEVSKTKVTWYDEGDIPAMQRPFMIFFDLDKMIGDSFDRGLAKIDSLATLSQQSFNEANLID